METSSDINLVNMSNFMPYSMISLDYKATHVQDCYNPCSGIAVPWTLGTVWTTHPYQHHLGSIGWTPIAFSKKHNEITICADNCVKVNLTSSVGHAGSVQLCLIL